jgi:hypothetical protein
MPCAILALNASTGSGIVPVIFFADNKLHKTYISIHTIFKQIKYIDFLIDNIWLVKKYASTGP